MDTRIQKRHWDPQKHLYLTGQQVNLGHTDPPRTLGSTSDSSTQQGHCGPSKTLWSSINTYLLHGQQGTPGWSGSWEHKGPAESPSSTRYIGLLPEDLYLPEKQKSTRETWINHGNQSSPGTMRSFMDASVFRNPKSNGDPEIFQGTLRTSRESNIYQGQLDPSGTPKMIWGSKSHPDPWPRARRSLWGHLIKRWILDFITQNGIKNP